MEAEYSPSHQAYKRLFVFALALAIQKPSLPLFSNTNPILDCNLAKYSNVHGYGGVCGVFID
jgi:hypothetical protein